MDYIREIASTVQVRFDEAYSNFESMTNLFILNSELEHLEIVHLIMNRRRELHLPNLRVLSIRLLDSNCPIKLYLPKLSKLLISGFGSQFEFLHPTSVTHLAVSNSNFLSHLDEFVQHFQECEYLHFLDIKFTDEQHIFTCFPKLKEIHCNVFTKESILNLIKQRKISRLLNVRIYFNGFSANELGDVEELFGNADRFVLTTQRMISNYHRLPRVVYAKVDLDYNELVRHFGNRLPSDFHTKLMNVRKLFVIGNVDDQADLLRFIEKLKPETLEIKFTSLNQASYFYKNLHLHWTRGSSLRIEENPGVIINLDVLIELSTLNAFSINQQIPYELVERLFNQSRNMDLEFLLNDQPIRIVLNGYNFLMGDESHIVISGRKYRYANRGFLSGLRKVFGI